MRNIHRYFHPPVNYSLRRKAILAIAIAVTILTYIIEGFLSPVRLLSKIGLISIFYIMDHLFDARFRPRHYLYIIAIGFMGFTLSPFYFIHPSYDKILHFLIPIMFCSITFHLVSKLHLEEKWRLAFTFFIIAGCIGIFEIVEYGLDSTFDLKLQGVYVRIPGVDSEQYRVVSNSIDDTMIDMTFGFIGATVFLVAKLIALWPLRFRRIHTRRQIN
jgi:hypothetical protein